MTPEAPREPIAIVGIGCRFPGAAGPRAFWELLSGGGDAIGDVPADRWDPDAFYDPDPNAPGKMITNRAGLIDDVDQFDWRTFRIPPREAKYMDPQHRLMLEIAWEAFEDAGVPFEQVAGSRVGVYIAIMWNDYLRLQARDAARLTGYSITGNGFAFVSNRVSYTFDLKGPSVAIDGACAGSLASLHSACQSLWLGECNMALAGGVNLMLSPDVSVMLSKAGVLSPEGRCMTLDSRADGFVRGEGAGLVLLKPISRVTPSDRIYAVIRGSAVNHNGHNEWIMAASPEGQEEVLADAYLAAGVDPASVDYVELHGTGTPKGDPIETRALSKVVGTTPGRRRPCAIGSVKTNIGHLDSAAGIAGVIKVALSLHNRQIPATLNLDDVNPDIDLERLGLIPQRALGPWPVPDRPGLAGVTAISMSGVNAHVVLEGPTRGDEPPPPTDPEADLEHLLVLSAPRPESVAPFAAALREQLISDEGSSLHDICFTASTRRSHHPHRLALVARSREALIEALSEVVDGRGSTEVLSSEAIPDVTDMTPEISATVDRLRAITDATGTIHPPPPGESFERPLVLRALGVLYVGGESISWEELYPHGGRFVDLPTTVWVRDRQWLDWLETADRTAPPTDTHAAAPTDSPADHAAPLVARLEQAPAEDRRDLLFAHLREQVARVLGIDPPQVLTRRQRFFDVGMNSLSAVELATLLQGDLGTEVPPTLAFEHPTLEDLTDHLAADLPVLDRTSRPRRRSRRDRDDPSADSTIGLRSRHDAANEPIALVGIGCRFPGAADSPDAFWQLLCKEEDAIGEIPANRWDVDALYDPDPDAPGKMYTRHGGFLDDIETFDARFFGISPREALSLDPQQRLLLEVSWEALENAGVAAERLEGSRTGVYVGVMESDYSKLHLRDGGAESLDAYYVTGNHFSFTAGRISYVLGLHGPAVAMDTACSSSLVAVHLACQSLRSGETDLALAGGVNLMLSPELTITMCKFKALSADGRCKTFDEAADGFGQGEGCGVVVLKRLSDAVAAGDNIIALIRGSAVNHDGPSGGLTVPNGIAQQALLRDALANAGVQPTDVSYVEAHGTGTSLGDPIEVRALGAVLGEGRSLDNRLFIGSVKTNIGHLDSAAGVAGLIKVALALRHKEIPAHLNLHTINPRISLDEIPVAIPTERIPWCEGATPRIAGVSSFGLSGTNAHIILEEAPEPTTVEPPEERPRHVLTLSARSEAALGDLADRYAHFLSSVPADELGDVCHAANTGRSRLEHRLAVVADSPAAMSHGLRAHVAGEHPDNVVTGESRDTGTTKLAFLFTGQGSQYVGMGRRLYETEPLFRQALDRCDEILRPLLEKPLLSVLFADGGSTNPLDETMYTQPALFSLEYALTELWRSWGIEPSAVMGHSVGEYAAACTAGVFGLEDGLELIAERGRLMQSLPKDGAMAVVFARLDQVEAAIDPLAASLSIAAVNGPENIVVSGERNALRSVEADLEGRGIRVQTLNVSHAFHSPLMEPILDDFEKAASARQFHAPAIPLLSNLTGRPFETGDIPGASYWRDHIRHGVRFSAGMESLHEQGHTVYVEIGPDPILSGMGRRCIPAGTNGITWISSLRQQRDDCEQMLESLGSLFVSGQDIDWTRLDRAGGVRRRPALPTYPFQRERYWLDEIEATTPTSEPGGAGNRSPAGHPLLGNRLSSPLRDIQFESRLSARHPSFLADHQVYGSVLVPGTAFLEMALAAADAGLDGPGHQLEDVAIREALVLPSDDPGAETPVQTILTPDDTGGAGFEILSRSADDAWTVHATGRIRVTPDGPTTGADELSLSEARDRCSEEIDADEFYSAVRASGLEYGPGFRGITELWRGPGEVIGRIELAGSPVAEREAYGLHPALLDSALQLGLAVTPEAVATDDAQAVYVPVGMDLVVTGGRPADRMWGHLRLRTTEEPTPGSIIADIVLSDEAGEVAARVEGLHLRRVSRTALQRLAQPNIENWLYEVLWEPIEQPADEDLGQVSEPGSWLILADEAGLGITLADALRGQGHECTLAFAADETATGSAIGRRLDPTQPGEFDRLVQSCLDDELQFRGAIYLWGLDSDGTALAPSVRGTGAALHLLQAMERAEGVARPDLWLITRGSQSVGSDPSLPGVDQAPIWGLGAVITSEHPDIRCVRLDLDPWPEGDEVDLLAAEIGSDHDETQVAHRAGRRFGARLIRGRFADDDPAGLLEVPSAPFHLDVATPGLIDTLELRSTTRQPPGPGDVEIRVLATGLNFKDVLKALGQYPLTGNPLGDECAGLVTAIGEGVEGLEVGSRVLAVASGSFRSHVTTSRELVVTLPDEMGFEQAASLPITYLTADYTLNHLAEVTAGQSVLIHAAAGGVGLVAVQLAKRSGAQIFATAGSPRKRALLRSMGVDHVMSSRNLDFVEEILGETDGRGVDIVLNSLADEYIGASLEVLARDGCFLEIGRTGIWDQDQMNAARPDVSYHPFYLGDVIADDPQLVRGMLVDLVERVRVGEIEPTPLHSFPLERVPGAFRFMAQARHIGKIVVTQREDGSEPTSETIRPDSTYLITGGLGGLGLAVAEWLIDRGASHLVLVGRSGAKGAAADEVDRLRKSGAQVVAEAVDVSDSLQVADLVAEISDTMPPLRGVVHAAAVLDDGILIHQTWDRLDEVFAPKATGAWNLHTSTRHLPLDFFVLFSSWAALVGLPGQGNYVAANAFLDSLAHHRRAEGLPALSVNWGAWATVGMAAAMDSRDQRRLSEMGLEAFVPELGVAALERLLVGSGPQMAVLSIDWSRYFDYFPRTRTLPVFRELAEETDLRGDTETSPGAGEPGSTLLTSPRGQGAVEERLRNMAARVLRLPVTKVDVSEPLADLGLDSLMTTELFAQIEREFDVHLPLATLIQAPTVAALSVLLAGDEPEPVSWNSLVEIQRGSADRNPIFLLHAEAGNVLLYRDLVRHLGTDQPVYGLQARGLDGHQIVQRTIEGMASDYISEILTVQPHGPYFLGGWCLGGTLAYEIAQQLRERDEPVEAVVMIQTEHHDYIRASRGAARTRVVKRMIDRLDYEKHELSRLDGRARLDYLGQKLQRVSARRIPTGMRSYLDKVPGQFLSDNAYFLEDLNESHKRAFWSYEPKSYQGRVVVIRASKQPRGVPSDPTLGWGELFDGEVDAKTIEAYHLTIMREPQVQQVAGVLNRYLSDLRTTPAS